MAKWARSSHHPGPDETVIPNPATQTPSSSLLGRQCSRIRDPSRSTHRWILLVIAELASLPVVVVPAGAVLFVIGLALLEVIGFRDSRQDGRGVLRSLGNGVREMWRWLCAVMPSVQLRKSDDEALAEDDAGGAARRPGFFAPGASRAP